MSGAVLVIAQERLLTRGVDESLVQRADNIGAALSGGALGPVLPGEGDQEDSFLQLIDSTGQVVAASSNVHSLPAAATGLALGSDQVLGTVAMVALSSNDFRVLARWCLPTAEP